MTFPDALPLAAHHHAHGTVALPGSKSLSNRALLLAALAEGTTRLANVLDSDDTRHMRTALATLGVPLTTLPNGEIEVQGRGGALDAPGEEPVDLFLGNAGTAMRPLTAVLAAGQGAFHLHGEPRMHERPIGHLLDALAPLGAAIRCTGTAGYPPLEITADGLSGGQTRIDGSVSSQFLTALLMAAPLADGPVQIAVEGTLVSVPYIRITLAAMAAFGVSVEHDAAFTHFRVEPATYRAPERFLVEGDASSASYFLAAGLLGGGPVRVTGAGRNSVQGDVAFADVLEALGARVTRGDDWIEVARPQGLNRLNAVDLDLNHIPDAAMTLAPLALFADGPCTIRNVANWRVKETDRLDAMARELAKVGAGVEEGEDWLRITPPVEPRANAAIDTYDDHRMAMCFALVALGGVPVVINDPGCTAKTFPTFFEEFNRLTSFTQ